MECSSIEPRYRHRRYLYQQPHARHELGVSGISAHRDALLPAFRLLPAAGRELRLRSARQVCPFYPGGASSRRAVCCHSDFQGRRGPVSFSVPATSGNRYISSYVVTPYIGGTPQSATTISAGSAGTISGSTGITYLQIPVTGLTNATAYTFTVYAVNNAGAGPESAQSGAGTPRAGMVFGDDFNGTVLDPEWYVYNRCGYIAQSEVEWYLPSQCVLDGAGNLTLVAVKTPHSGPSYPSDGHTYLNQAWLSGACQSNTRSYTPGADINTLTFETRFQIPPGIAGGMWPGSAGTWRAPTTRPPGKRTRTRPAGTLPGKPRSTWPNSGHQGRHPRPSAPPVSCPT